MVHTKSTNWASPTRDGLTDNKTFMLSTRDALNEKQVAEKHFYVIRCDAWSRFVTETKTLLLYTILKVSSRKDALCAVRDSLGVPTLDGQPCEHCGAHLSQKYPEGCVANTANSFFQDYRTFRHHCNDYTHRRQIRKHRSFAKKVVHTTAV